MPVRRSFASPALLPLAALLFAACTAVSEHAAKTPGDEGGSAGGTDSGTARLASAATTTTSGGTVAAPADTTTAAPVAAPAVRIDVDKEFPVVRALYVNRFAAQSAKKMARLIQIADQTEINALVIDMKDEFGLNYKPSNPAWAKNAGTSGTVRNLPALLDTLRAHKILPIARLVVFKDSVTARLNPDHTIRQPDGSVWRDKKGLAWVNPYDRSIWAYNMGIAEELAQMGFGEIQFDYIRFPEPYKSLPAQVFPGNKGESKPDALAAFLKEANARIDKHGARTTADIFGLTTTVGGPLEIGQWWERVSPNVDVVLPMVYPSHYPRGDLGLAVPNAEPYKVLHISLTRAKQRDEKLGIKHAEHVRPWLQAFTLGKPPYGPAELEAQKKGTYDAGYDGWVLWSPGSKYEPFLPALEKTLVSRKKS
ncbi:MAG: putative glycoside hydrolase [Gemmatimonadaceae bacterium]|nr:putative glycoside hydrolase [Gemmatimonadaceae bacterium]HWJ45605.1 putative glycoside hydrolase [Gaiellaceae bacterium]NUO93695.1 putative glycoside hydrolase [Gemmatimonadaceae bacterium]NUP54763.1 putative glycoside hydrolase [Gemmatimonadaceae bacterium]NUP72118.1 putative glycoside hydrolase [Gemmatimonadaceae bacterium]